MSDLSNSLNLVVATDSSNVSINDNNIRLDLIDGYEECSDQMQKYLQRYALNPETKTLHAMQLGYTTSSVDRWFEDENFSKVAQVIYDLYTQELKAADLKDAVTNSKIRNRVIQSREKGGRYSEDKTVNNNIINTGASFGDVMKMLQNDKKD